MSQTSFGLTFAGCATPGHTVHPFFHGDYAVVGRSKSRENKTFSGIALDENLKRRDGEAHCGLQVIELRSGDVVHRIRIEGVVTELYEVVTLARVARPQSLGFKTDEIRRVLRVGHEEIEKEWK